MAYQESLWWWESSFKVSERVSSQIVILSKDGASSVWNQSQIEGFSGPVAWLSKALWLNSITFIQSTINQSKSDHIIKRSLHQVLFTMKEKNNINTEVEFA